MSKFFINRPIVAMVISIIMMIVGVVAMVQLPIAQFPDIAPPEILVGDLRRRRRADGRAVRRDAHRAADAGRRRHDLHVLDQRQQRIDEAQGRLRRRHEFNADQILTQMRYLQAESQLPMTCATTASRSRPRPPARWRCSLVYSPKGTYDSLFLSNYATININDPMSRLPGVGQVQIFGAGQYAMRFWLDPDTLSKLGITVTEILDALNKQNTVNPAGQIGGEPVPPGQQFTYTVRAQGRLVDEAQFGDIVVRANVDGSLVRMRDVARIDLGSQSYSGSVASTASRRRSSPSTSCPAATRSTPCTGRRS